MWARRRLEHRQHAAEAKRSHDAREAHGHLEKSRIFEVRDEYGRVMRYRAFDAEHLRAELTPGYTITGECYGFHDDGTGGISAALDASTPTIMRGLLGAHGVELIAWLEQQGFTRKRDA